MGTETRAILFTDIVGYSRMMSNDEKLALSLLSEHDRIVGRAIKDSTGSVIKNIGDAFFAEFESAQDALGACIAFQSEFQKRNKLKEKKEQIWVRAAVHQGQVLRRDNDLFGHDVNICARLESIAPQGGVVASASLLSQIKTKPKHCREIGYLKLKNINDPVQAFRIYLDRDEHDAQSQGQLFEYYENRGVEVVDIESYQTQDIFSTAFLYPRDLTGKQDATCYGLLEGLVSDFQKIDRVRTPSVADISKLKDSEADLLKISQILQVESVIETTISSDKKGVVVEMRMFDTKSGDFTWSGKWRQSSSDLRLIRGEIIRDILSHYNMSAPDQILKYLEREFTSNADAMRLYYDAMQLVNRAHETSDLESARDLFIDALGHDGKFVEARAQLGVTYNKLGYSEDAERELDEAMRIAESEKYEQSQAFVCYLVGIVNQGWYKDKKAIRYYERALELQVKIEDKLSQAKTLNSLADAYATVSKVDKAQELLEQSVEIRKHLEEADSLAYPYATMGNIAFSRNDYSDSISYCQKSHGLFKKQANEYFCSKLELILANCHTQLGAYNQAEEYLDMARPICEEFDEAINVGWLYQLDAHINMHQKNYNEAIKDLRKANNKFLQYGDLIESSVQVTQDLIQSHIELKDLDAAGEEVKNLKKLNKRIKEKDKLLFKDIHVAYYDSCRGKIDIDRADELSAQVISYFDKDRMDVSTSCWMLAKCYINLGSKENAKKMQKQVDKILKMAMKSCSNAKDQDAYYSNGLHQQMMVPIRAYQRQSKKAEKLSCKSCGFELPDKFKFCPGCGAKI